MRGDDSTNNKYLSVFYCNARSLIPKLGFLCNYASTYNPSLIAVTESWLTKDIPSGFLNLPRYVDYRKDRDFARGGGSVLLVRDDVVSRPVSLPPLQSRIDAVACQIVVTNDLSLGCLCIYRPPNSEEEDNLKMLSVIRSFLSLNFHHNLILGDFNYPDINWSQSYVSGQGDTFFRFTQNNFLLQHVMMPTRRISNSVLDLVFTTPNTFISDLLISEELANSDHYSISFSVEIKPERHKRKVIKRNVHKADWIRFRQLLPTLNWQPMQEKTNVNDAWFLFLANMNSALDVVAPRKTLTVRNFISSPRVRTALRRKRRCFHLLSQDQSLTNIIAYVKSVGRVEDAIREDTSLRENRILKSKNPKLFWIYINRRLSNNHQIKSIRIDNNEIVDEFLIANKFNEYFSSVFSPKADSLLTATASRTATPSCSFDICSVSTNDVFQALLKIPPKTSCDSDDLCYKMLKEGGQFLAYQLSSLFSISLSTGQLPSSWKVAVVTPIHKKGSRVDVKNYRPISITSCCCRTLERIIRSKLNVFLRQNNIISSTQHGFQAGRSTDSILLQFYDYVTREVDSGRMVETVFFDFAKAFDRIPHLRLIDRISAIGVSGSVLRWLDNFLNDRRQRVRVGTTVSELQNVTSGIVQGSVLGPTLFNIFINNIDTSVKNSKILKYADDIRIYLSSSKESAALQELRSQVQYDIDSLSAWAEDSGMTFNVSKCFQVSFGLPPHKDHLLYNVNGDTLSHILNSSFNDLGLTVSSPLTFNNHVNEVTNKAFQRLGLINKIFVNKTQACIVQLYKSFVRPLVEYSSIVWCPYTDMNIAKVERIQKRMTKMFPSLRHLPYRDRLESLGLLSLRARRLRFQLIYAFKMYQRKSDNCFLDFFTFSKASNTRGHCAKLIHEHNNRNYRSNFFTVSVVNIWNKLQPSAITAPSLTIFKSELADFFKKQDIW